jgi:hypothetical protein
MRKTWLLFLALCAACAAPDLSTLPRDERFFASLHHSLRAAFLAEALPTCPAYQGLRELCEQAPLRLAGSPGAERAVEWGRGAFERAGLANVRLEPCTVPRWERGEVEELTVVEPAEHAGERIPILALGGSVPTPAEGLEADVLAVTSFEELQARAAEAAGRIVLFARPMDRAQLDPFEAYGGAVSQRSNGAVEAAQAGGVAALVRSMTLAQDDEPHTGALRYQEGVPPVPAAAVSTNGAERIGAWLSAGKRVRLRLALACRTLADVPSANVVGEIPGRERPGEVVLLGAHLDAWDVGQGAHDDGAGCAHLVGAARMLVRHFRQADIQPRRTIRFVLFMNEENGLRGALAYRDAHLAELPQHVLAIESDRGGFMPLGWAADATGASLTALRQLLGGPETTRGGGADISVLAEHGVPLVGLYPNPQRYFDFHHSRKDVPAAVDARELEHGSAWLAALAYLAAMQEDPLPRSEPRPRRR